MPESSPPQSTTELAMTLQIASADVDDEGLDRMTRQLRTELEEAGVGSATLAPGFAPPGAKVFDPISLGAVILKFAPTALPAVLDVLKSWIGRDAGRTVKVSVKVGDRSVDVEFSPHQMASADVTTFVASITKTLEPTTN